MLVVTRTLNSRARETGERIRNTILLCRPLRGLGSINALIPSDESLGYFQSSAFSGRD